MTPEERALDFMTRWVFAAEWSEKAREAIVTDIAKLIRADREEGARLIEAQTHDDDDHGFQPHTMKLAKICREHKVDD